MSDFRRPDKDPDLTSTRLQPSRRGTSSEDRLQVRQTAQPRIDPSQVLGWGADLDRADRPAVPMERTPPRLEGLHWSDPPESQQTEIEVLVSAERPALTPVFGTSVPPSGLSGQIRRAAFKHSENNIRHWLMLLFADRVNVIEGLFSDARKSKKLHSVAAVGLVGVLALMWVRRR